MALLIFSFLLRMVLIFNGGEPLHDDGPEFFGFSKRLYQHLTLQNWHQFFNLPVFGHWGGALAGIIPFALTPTGFSAAHSFAIFFSIPAVINIYLVYRITTNLGGDSKIALLAAGLQTFSFSALYQTQHGLYCDLSLMFFLAGIIFVLKNDRRHLMVFTAGILFFLCFFIYYGYWTLALVGLLFSTMHGDLKPISLLWRAVLSGSGFIALFILFLFFGYQFDTNYFEHFSRFSGTITHGNFEDGYKVPILFLWHAEGALFLVWTICLLASIQKKCPYPIKSILASIAFIYLLWVIGSNVAEKFVVYGRLVKVLSPFLCILSAFYLSSFSIPRILIIFLLIAPGFFINVAKIWPPTYFQDIIKHEKYLRKEKVATHSIRLKSRCLPDESKCTLVFPANDSTNCTIEKSYLARYNMPFNQYDGITAEFREILHNHQFFIDIESCLLKQ